jgi:NitT/TauT family transport system ATP-binding protein
VPDDAQTEIFLQIDQISARFTSRLGQLEALEDVTFRVKRGEFVCLIGPSGCGKSTLLRIIAGLLPPVSGQVLINGHPRWRPDRTVGLVFQSPTLLPWRSVQENVALPLSIAGMSAREAERITLDLLEMVGLSDFAAEHPANLSGGMAQRAAIARALAQDPDLLLLDEPFGALDALTREQLTIELLRIWENSHRTVVMVTHNVEEAALLADRVVVLSARPGRIVDILPICIPRPRDPAMLTSPELQRAATRLREALCRGNGQGVVCPTPNG